MSENFRTFGHQVRDLFEVYCFAVLALGKTERDIEVSLYTFVHQVSARYDCTP